MAKKRVAIMLKMSRLRHVLGKARKYVGIIASSTQPPYTQEVIHVIDRALVIRTGSRLQKYRELRYAARVTASYLRRYIDRAPVNLVADVLHVCEDLERYTK